MTYQWTESDDIAALYVYKFGGEHLPYTIEEIAKKKGIKIGSFKMRIQNFGALDDKGGLNNYAKQSKAVYERYNTLSEAELRRLAFPEL